MRPPELRVEAPSTELLNTSGVPVLSTPSSSQGRASNLPSGQASPCHAGADLGQPAAECLSPSPLLPVSRETCQERSSRAEAAAAEDEAADGAASHGSRGSLLDTAVLTLGGICSVAAQRLRALPLLGPVIGRWLPDPEVAKRAAAVAAERRRALNSALRGRHREFLSARELSIHVCTWNVGQGAPPPDLGAWLRVADGETLPDGELPDVVAVSLQEAELSGAALVLEVTDTYVTWLEALLNALNQHPSALEKKVRFRRVEAVQLVGMILVLLVRSDHIDEVRNVRKAITRTGALALMGNKGAIGIRATIYGKRFLFIGAHFAPHDRNVSIRDANYRNSLAELKLDVGDVIDDEADHCVDAKTTASRSFDRGDKAARKVGSGFRWQDRVLRSREKSEAAVHSGHRLVRNHDYVFFAGDLNYRVMNFRFADAVQAAVGGDFDALLANDQLRKGITEGTIFRGFDEADIDFAPTYKYDVGTTTFDTSAKHRTPAYTDRVLFRCLRHDERDVAPFAPVRSRLSTALGRAARPFRRAADPLQLLAARARRASGVPRTPFTPQMPRRRVTAMQSSPSLVALDTPSAAFSPDGRQSGAAADSRGVSPEDQRMFEAAKLATEQRQVAFGARGEGVSSAASSDGGDDGVGMRGFPYIINDLAVDRYCSYPQFTSSDHKPVAAAFRAVVVQRDVAKTRRVVFECLQELGFDDFGSAGDLDWLD